MDSVGYKTLSSFTSDDKTRTSIVFVDPSSRMYKVYFHNTENNTTTSSFKFFTIEEAAENAAESWVLKNE
jgi:hypothetical protein